MTSETANQQMTQDIISGFGGYAWRNNSGAFTDQDGRVIRYGLGNISKKWNEEFKSSDLVGVLPVLIQPYMVGYHLGVIVALEIKPSGWHLTPGDKRGQAQARWQALVRQACGFAGFVTCPEDVYRIIGSG